MSDTCYYCGREFGLLEQKTEVRYATKPPGKKFRFKRLGLACEGCAEPKHCHIDKWRRKNKPS